MTGPAEQLLTVVPRGPGAHAPTAGEFVRRIVRTCCAMRTGGVAAGPVGTRFALPDGAVVTLPDSAGT
ncbi:hypothetical protein ACWC2K_06315 [Streptomyces chattanoogensis]|uniref:hypothetical protein n=1 Tax=Streptomyces chattanoogensis TaxID=66876 RepID=UPI0036BF704E